MKFAITAVAGLALAAGASADVNFSHAGPDTLAGGQGVDVFSGSASGSLSIFTWSFDYDETVSDSSWASDMAIDITDPNGNTVRIGGYDIVGLITPYDGPASDVPGNYGGSFDLSGNGLSGSGTWTVRISDDWGGDPNANIVSNFNGTLGRLVPTPGALGLFGIAGLAATRRRR